MAICKRCGKTVIKTKTSNNAKFCINCFLIDLTCNYCGRKTTRPRSIYEFNKFKVHFCDVICRQDYFRIKPRSKTCKRCSKEFSTLIDTNYCSEYCKTHKTCVQCGTPLKISGAYGQTKRFCHQCLQNHNKESARTRKQSLPYKTWHREYNIKTRLYGKIIKHDFSVNDWQKKLKQTNGVCPGYKRKPHFVGVENLTLDHIYPISKAPQGKVYKINDVQPLCLSCNCSKGCKIKCF